MSDKDEPNPLDMMTTIMEQLRKVAANEGLSLEQFVVNPSPDRKERPHLVQAIFAIDDDAVMKTAEQRETDREFAALMSGVTVDTTIEKIDAIKEQGPINFDDWFGDDEVEAVIEHPPTTEPFTFKREGQDVEAQNSEEQRLMDAVAGGLSQFGVTGVDFVAGDDEDEDEVPGDVRNLLADLEGLDQEDE